MRLCVYYFLSRGASASLCPPPVIFSRTRGSNPNSRSTITCRLNVVVNKWYIGCNANFKDKRNRDFSSQWAPCSKKDFNTNTLIRIINLKRYRRVLAVPPKIHTVYTPSPGPCEIRVNLYVTPPENTRRRLIITILFGKSAKRVVGRGGRGAA